MTEPERDNGDVVARVEESHRAAVAKDMWSDGLAGKSGTFLRRGVDVLGEAVLDCIRRQSTTRPQCGEEARRPPTLGVFHPSDGGREWVVNWLKLTRTAPTDWSNHSRRILLNNVGGSRDVWSGGWAFTRSPRGEQGERGGYRRRGPATGSRTGLIGPPDPRRSRHRVRPGRPAGDRPGADHR